MTQADVLDISFADGPSEGEEGYPGVILNLVAVARIVDVQMSSADKRLATGAVDGISLPAAAE